MLEYSPLKTILRIATCVKIKNVCCKFVCVYAISRKVMSIAAIVTIKLFSKSFLFYHDCGFVLFWSEKFHVHNKTKIKIRLRYSSIS